MGHGQRKGDEHRGVDAVQGVGVGPIGLGPLVGAGGVMTGGRSAPSRRCR